MSKSKTYGMGSYEPKDADNLSKWEARAEFMRAVEQVEPEAVLSLYDDVFSGFVTVAWQKFPDLSPEPIKAWLADPRTNPFDKALIEIVKTALENNPHVDSVFISKLFLSECTRGFKTIELKKIVEVFPDWETVKSDEQCSDVCNLLLKWGEKWNLKNDWCFDFVLRVLCVWINDRWQSHHRSSLSFNRGISELILERHWIINGDVFIWENFEFKFQTIEFSAYGWNPEAIERKYWAKNTEVEFKQYLKEEEKQHADIPAGVLTKFRAKQQQYLSNIEGVADVLGLVKCPKKWAEHHFIWTAHYQVQRWSMTKIEQTYLAAHATVSEAIKSVRHLIDLDKPKEL